MAIIKAGPGNSINKAISHTNEIEDSWIEFLGLDPENVDVVVDGAVVGSDGVLLNDSSVVELRQKANKKG